MAAEVSVLSYNVRSLRDDLGALARVVRACAPDVLCVQEAPRFFRWRRHAARLGRATGLMYVTGGAPTCGTMIMADPRARVERTADLPMPLTPGLHRRALSAAVLRFGGAARLGVISFHLSLEEEERWSQGGLLLSELRRLGAPAAVAAGDVNERPGGRTFRRLAGELQDGWAVAPGGGGPTYPSTGPHKRIDAVLCTAAVEVTGCGVPVELPGARADDPARATDHLPVLATLRIPDPG
ncbi:endonuclease/exonuclease/phosphatase family protein [Streptomyces sodiiphilus]|uniref:Endonuclease/exonuclease/phosphatase family protein n=1 Tax=Streptomyces sodiiphilus TaxID=226217 RepID=A0ABN2PWI1_9ACTN